MDNHLKKLLLISLGTAAYSCEKTSNFIDKLIEKGRLTAAENDELSEGLMRTKNKDSKPLTKQDIIEIFKSSNLVTKDELSELTNRVSLIEKKLN